MVDKRVQVKFTPWFHYESDGTDTSIIVSLPMEFSGTGNLTRDIAVEGEVNEWIRYTWMVLGEIVKKELARR